METKINRIQHGDTSRIITQAIIHCSDTPDGKRFDAADIRRWHTDPKPKGRGWSDIGYHFMILPNGVIEAGRPMIRAGAHALGHNSDSIGICMVGRARFSPAAWASLRALIQTLTHTFPGLSVIAHRDVNPHKNCPGFSVWVWLENEMCPERQHVLDPLDAPVGV